MQKAKQTNYDIIIIGGGPAGLAAAIYAGRARRSTLLLEQRKEGGQIAQTAEIENFPGSLPGESGASLTQRMTEQAKSFGVEITYDTITALQLEGKEKCLQGEKNSYCGKTVIIATGAAPLPLHCPGETEFLGKGVSYCATCDGAFFTGLDIYVVGGGDAAVEEALYLTRFGRKVTIIHRRDQLRAAQSIQQKAFANPNIHFLWNHVVKELSGDGLLQRIVVENVQTKECQEIIADEADGLLGLFVFIGLKPNTKLFMKQLEMEQGYIKTDEKMHTNLPGVFAAGDVRIKSLRQVVTAAADGAIAAVEADQYLSNQSE